MGHSVVSTNSSGDLLMHVKHLLKYATKIEQDFLEIQYVCGQINLDEYLQTPF